MRINIQWGDLIRIKSPCVKNGCAVYGIRLWQKEIFIFVLDKSLDFSWFYSYNYHR